MSNLSHSFSKRSYGGNGFGTATHKSVYDDVFGGPPKFGMPTLAPRLEDYTEIFGGFHSARGASIPILDLPVVDGAELCFDVRSSRFDYGEVFGGFDGLDFTHSLDDFVRKSNGGNDSSGDDAWSPAESESPSSDTDPSAFSERSQSLINEDVYHPAAYIGQFDASFNEANQRSKEKISNLAKNAAQSHYIPGSNISPKVTVQTHGTSHDLKSNMGFDGGTLEVRTIILPGKFELRRQERDCENYRRPGPDKIKPFVTVSDINLRTKPSRLPPPSRPPPVYADKKESLAKLKRVEDPSSYLAQTEDGSPLPIYDVEIDGSSSKSATATMRDPMEKTQAMIGSAKESIDVKEVLQTCPPQNFTELVLENANKTVESISSCNDDTKAKSAERSGETVALGEDKSNLFKIDEEVPDLPEPDRYIDLTKRSTNRRNGKGGGLSAQAFAWRQESKYFEVVEADMPLKDIEQHNDETKFLQKDSNEFRNWVANEAFDQKEISGFKEAKEAPKLHEKKSKVEVSVKACDEGTRSKAVSRSGSQTVSPKIAKVDLKSCESEMNSKKIKTAKVPEEMWRLPNDSGGDGDDQTDDDIIVLEVNHKPRGFREKTGSTVMVDDSYAWILNESNLREDLEAEKDDERLSELVKEAENKRTAILLGKRKEQDQCREKEKNRKTDEEVFGTNDCEYMSKEVIDLKDNEKRPAELKDNGKISEKSFETNQNRKSQELDGSTVTFLEFDIEERSTVTSISTISTPVDPCEHQELSRCASDAKHKYFGGELANADQMTCAMIESEGIKPFDSTDELNNNEHGACLSGGTGFGKVEATQAAVSCEQREDLKTKLEESEHGTDARVTNHLVKEDSLSANQDELQYAKCEDGIPHVVNLENDGNEVSSDISNSSIKLDTEVSERSSKSECTKVKAYEQEQRGKKTGGVELKFSHRISKDNLTSYQPREVSSENGKGTGASLTAKLRDRELPLSSGKNCFQQVKEKNMRENPAVRDNEIEARLQKQRELELEHLRKIEEEKEREKEREKDRMAIDRATLEAHNRLYADARQRSERASIDRATAEVRQRAVAEAREKLEKSSLEARERYLTDKASAEARLKAERAAVERATLEARQRAFEKAMADRVLPEGRDRVERSVSDKFFTSRTDEFRQSSSFFNGGTSNALHYSYSSAHVGNDSDSPQRCKARLERYRRTAERAAKALEEKNSRDLVAQREQAERSRLAETLDAEVKRWSNGKEGNLRALLSTLQYILLPESGWQPIPLTEVITSAAVKKAYRKATLCVHPDKLQQRGASIQQKYVCEKVFDLLKEAWNTFNSEER